MPQPRINEGAIPFTDYDRRFPAQPPSGESAVHMQRVATVLDLESHPYQRRTHDDTSCRSPMSHNRVCGSCFFFAGRKNKTPDRFRQEPNRALRPLVLQYMGAQAAGFMFFYRTFGLISTCFFISTFFLHFGHRFITLAVPVTFPHSANILPQSGQAIGSRYLLRFTPLDPHASSHATAAS